MLRSPSGCLTLAGVASILAIGHAEAQTPPPGATSCQGTPDSADAPERLRGGLSRVPK